MDALRARQGRTVSREFLMQAIYGSRRNQPEIKIIDVMVCSIRRQLADTPYCITADYGLGLRFERRDEVA